MNDDDDLYFIAKSMFFLILGCLLILVAVETTKGV